MAGWDAGSGNSQCIKNPIFISYNLSAKMFKKKKQTPQGEAMKKWALGSDFY